MAQKKVYLCDVCGKERKDAHHWFCMVTAGTSIHFRAFEVNPDDAEYHLCGQGCLMTKISEQLHQVEAAA